MGTDEVLAALDNPLRCKLLRFISEHGPVSFSTLLRHADIETSKLSFHLKKMRTLLDQDDKKRYELTDEGVRAADVLAYLDTGKRLTVTSATSGGRSSPPADPIQRAGLVLFGGGMLMLLAYPLYMFLTVALFAEDTPAVIGLGVTAIVLGVVILLVAAMRDRKNAEKEDDDDEYTSRKY
ncbi:MAG: helix-turn-helix domain-containing protein [Candidatus Undinarchaeales archaeon]|jgi:DNA-binding transcriptional ArsR family regulator|nr:helix-turn-helix domain-containing protein [Candidatus Undinarchaeales archaeon]MDP7492792.1 helix-turn-helix domain-containing protein [Candidatus Undinarchaeales archaeon]